MRKHKSSFQAEAIGVPDAAPVIPDAADNVFALSDDVRLKARVLVRANIALRGHRVTPADAYAGVLCGAIAAVEADIARSAFLNACNEEYTRALDVKRGPVQRCGCSDRTCPGCQR